MQSQLTLLRIFHKWAKVHEKEKIDKEVSKLKQQLTSNQMTWEELNHSQRRETILKQELANAQTILSTSEKNIEKLQKEIEEINSERLRLQMFRDNKIKQTEILEDFLKTEKESKLKQESLKKMLENNKKIKSLQEKEQLAAQQFLPNLETYEIDVKRLKSQLEQVRFAKDQAFERLESIRSEVESRSQKINWKEKFINLTRNMTDSTSRSFVYSTSRSPIKMNDSLNNLSSKSKSPTLPKISDRSITRL
jgi:chromosome segregation ATPase